jgi:hypothetical protein
MYDRSKTYPLPLKQYLASMVAEASTTAFAIYSQKPSTMRRRKKERPKQLGQLSLPSYPRCTKIQTNRKQSDMTTSFEDILNTPMDSIKPPPLLPVGSYHTVIKGLPEKGKSKEKQTDFFKFTHRIIAALDDVDPEELETAFPEGVAGKEIDNSFYITEKSAFMLTDFLKNCGITGLSVREAIDNTPNAEVIIFVKHEPSQDGQRMFARVGRTAPVE